MRINSLSLFVTLILCVVLTATAQTASTPTAAIVVPEEKSKPITIPKFDTPPTIDGKLDEEVWQKAAVHPKFLYIAFKATDEPDKVRSTIAKRDNIFNDDYVGFFLDTFTTNVKRSKSSSTPSEFRQTAFLPKAAAKTSASTC